MTPYPKARKPLKKSSQAWKNRVLELFGRDGYICQHCLKSLPYEELAPHHIKTKGAGGSDDLSNLITLCADCHYRVHTGEIMNLALKKKYDPIWPDIPREDIYQAREYYKQDLIGLGVKTGPELDQKMEEWDREHRI